jgi:hypothetical protein
MSEQGKKDDKPAQPMKVESLRGSGAPKQSPKTKGGKK